MKRLHFADGAAVHAVPHRDVQRFIIRRQDIVQPLIAAAVGVAAFEIVQLRIGKRVLFHAQTPILGYYIIYKQNPQAVFTLLLHFSTERTILA